MRPRDLGAVLVAFVGALAAVAAGWFAVGGVVAAFAAWPLLVPEVLAAAVAAVAATSRPRPRVVEFDREGQ
jgi:hypothetical protein